MNEQTFGTISPQQTLEVLNNIKQILEVTPISGPKNVRALLQAMELVDGLIASQEKLCKSIQDKELDEVLKTHLSDLVKDNATNSNSKVGNEK